MLYRIIGPSGYGKSAYIFEKLGECIKNEQKAFLIIPEQSAVETEKRVIQTLGNKSNMYIEVINFKRLCNRVFRETGGLASPHAHASSKKLIMAKALCEIKPFLCEYAPLCESGDFIEKALSCINEFKVCGVTSDILTKIAGEFADDSTLIQTSRKLLDLALINDAYEKMYEQFLGDKTDIYEKLCEKLEKSAFFSDYVVFVDSFYGFTGQEKNILSYIINDAKDTYVSITLKENSKDIIFKRSLDAAHFLEKCAKENNIEIFDVVLSENRRHKEYSGLYIYEKSFDLSAFALDGQSDKEGDDSINIYSCADTFDECLCALATVSKLVRGGAKYSDICICAKDIREYSGLLDVIFEKGNVPLSLDTPKVLSESALSQLLLSGIEAAFSRSTESVLRFVKTGLSGLDEELLCVFESYVLTWSIKGKLLRGDEDWLFNPDGYSENAPDEEILEKVNKARKTIVNLLDFLEESLKNADNMTDCCRGIYLFLCEIAKNNGVETFDDMRGGIFFDLLCKCLDTLCALDDGKKVTPTEFVRLYSLISGDFDTGSIPESLDCVKFASIDLVRAQNTPYIIILGVNDGVFPSSCANTSFFTNREKVLLSQSGMELSPPQTDAIFDEMFLSYCTISSAKEKAFLLYHTCGKNDEVMYPSSIIKSISYLTGSKICTFDRNDFANTFCGDKLLFEAFCTVNNAKTKATLRKYFEGKDEFKQKLEFISSFGKTADKLSTVTLESLYPKNIVTSYSRLENFNMCPFSHFCNYTLGLKPETKASLGPLETGSIIHKILEQFVPILTKSKKDGQILSLSDAKEIIIKLLDEYLLQITGAKKENYSKRFLYLYSRLSKLLFAMAENLIREVRVSDFEMCDVELDISDKGDIKPYEMKIGEHTLKIRGKIDKVDKLEKDGKIYIRIVDYKTGSKLFKYDDILNGFNLQMLLYLSSISKMGNEYYGGEIVPAGVLYNNVVSPDQKQNLGYDDEQLKNTLEPKSVSSGVLLEDEDILFAMDKTKSGRVIPVKYTKEGLILNNNTLPLDKMGELLDFAQNAASDLAKEILDGNISINPFSNSSVDACRYCDMSPVCMGDGNSTNIARIDAKIDLDNQDAE